LPYCPNCRYPILETISHTKEPEDESKPRRLPIVYRISLFVGAAFFCAGGYWGSGPLYVVGAASFVIGAYGAIIAAFGSRRE